MKKITVIVWNTALSSVILTSCESKNDNQTIAITTDQATLTLVANGEDFVRQGFVSKDGWQINFDHLYVNISEATAYQADSSFQPQKGDTKDSFKYQDRVEFINIGETTDLAFGDANSAPILVAKTDDAPVGFYNALTWKLSTAEAASSIAGNTIVLQGKATKDEQTINFDLGFNQPTEYICGEFIGEERQGIVAVDASGRVEATFHFDHIFGDANAPIDDALNQDALGFQPLADLAVNQSLKLDEQALSSNLSSQNYQKLTEAVLGLGHVGEGHCVISNQ